MRNVFRDDDAAVFGDMPYDANESDVPCDDPEPEPAEEDGRERNSGSP